MKLKKLGNTELALTSIGIGTSVMGGTGWEFSFGPQDDTDCISAIHSALDHGINWIDTAAVYGLGHAEEIVAKALKGRSPRPFVFTKCGIVWDRQGRTRNSLKAGSIRQELESSLHRLNTDAIDLYQIHWPIPDGEIEKAWTEVARLQEEGKVRYIGLSNFNVMQMERAHRIVPITSLQTQYSILARQAEVGVLPFAQQNNIGVIAYAPMGSGLLTGGLTRDEIAKFSVGDFRRRMSNFREPRLSLNLEIAETLRTIGGRYGRTAGEVAIAWVLRNPAVTGTVVGVKNRVEVAGVMGALEFRLAEVEAAEIEQAAKRSLLRRIIVRVTEVARDLRAPAKAYSPSRERRIRDSK